MCEDEEDDESCEWRGYEEYMVATARGVQHMHT
jgi:hypothetical protein